MPQCHPIHTLYNMASFSDILGKIPFIVPFDQLNYPFSGVSFLSLSRGFYAQSASEAMFRARTYNCITY